MQDGVSVKSWPSEVIHAGYTRDRLKSAVLQQQTCKAASLRFGYHAAKLRTRFYIAPAAIRIAASD